MENTTPTTKSSVTPVDFFLWAGAMVALYGSVISFITLLFEYINHAYPDALASYGDPYSSAIRFSMAALIVLVPTTVGLLYFIRRSIVQEPGKAAIWVRRWALMLTLFVMGAAIAVDLITLINYFLGGETTIRFLLKVAIVLLVTAGVFMHFLADLKGYWLTQVMRARYVGIAVIVLAIATIAAGFLIIGTPGTVRLIRFDEQKVNDLQNIQYQLTSYYETKKNLPASLDVLSDPISGYTLPVDPQSHEGYEYTKVNDTSFTLCTTFNKPSQDMAGKGGNYASPVAYPGIDVRTNHWDHQTGRTCFTRTIDPTLYTGKPMPI